MKTFSELTKEEQLELFKAWQDGKEIEYHVKSSKPSINWDHVHSDYNWMAVDDGGIPCLFKAKPTKMRGWRLDVMDFIKHVVKKANEKEITPEFFLVSLTGTIAVLFLVHLVIYFTTVYGSVAFVVFIFTVWLVLLSYAVWRYNRK